MRRLHSGGGRERTSGRLRPLPVHRNGHRNGRGVHGHEHNGHARAAAVRAEPQIAVRVARRSDVVHVRRIQSLMLEARESGAILAPRDDDYLVSAIREGRAVVVLHGETLVGFAAAHAWEEERYVSHSAMIVAPALRGRGLSRRMKSKLIELTRRRWPNAAILSLTLSNQVERLNKSFGFEPVPYCDLTKDPEFWKGCESCIHFPNLKRNQQQDCHCWSGLLLPAGQARAHVIPRDAHGHPSASGGG